VCKEFYDLKSEMCYNTDIFINRLEPYKVIFIGDYHDSADLHVKVAKIIKALGKRGYKIHLANEWFSPKQNDILYKFTNSKIDADTFKKEIKWENIGYDFKSYAPIYEAIKEINGSMYGINLTKDERKMISDENLTAMSSDERAFYNSLDLNTTSHKKLLEHYFKHCHKKRADEDTLTCKRRIYRVMVAWDSKMALESYKLSKKVLKTPKDKLIVFAGAFHLQSHLGINMRFSRLSDILHVTLLPQQKPQEPLDLGYSDFIVLYDGDSK
jgi:uncharacterized iron-regulated protein